MPLFFHGFDVIRVNSYLVGKDRRVIHRKGDHKNNVMELVGALLDRTSAELITLTRAMQREQPSRRGQGNNKRQRMSTKNPELPACRLEGPTFGHRTTSWCLATI